MSKEDRMIILATLEAYRLKVEDKPKESGNKDHLIRVCQAIVAKALGFNGRNEWTEEIECKGYISYDYEVDKKEQYFFMNELLEKL